MIGVLAEIRYKLEALPLQPTCSMLAKSAGSIPELIIGILFIDWKHSLFLLTTSPM
jgi:hypothetical protein